MNELEYRRVAGGRDPDRDVLRDGAGGSHVWRSRGAAAGRFEARPEALAMVRAAADAVVGVAPPAAPGGAGEVRPEASEGAGGSMEHLAVGGSTLVVRSGSAVAGPWGALLAACRSAVDEPGDPVAAVAVTAEPPDRVRLEHRGGAPLELGFGALVVAIRWAGEGVDTSWSEARISDGVVTAEPGWSRAFEVHGVGAPAPGATPAGMATLSIKDDGVWIPVSLAEPARSG
jgi:hypothetical protein